MHLYIYKVIYFILLLGKIIRLNFNSQYLITILYIYIYLYRKRIIIYSYIYIFIIIYIKYSIYTIKIKNTKQFIF